MVLTFTAPQKKHTFKQNNISRTDSALYTHYLSAVTQRQTFYSVWYLKARVKASTDERSSLKCYLQYLFK